MWIIFFLVAGLSAAGAQSAPDRPLRTMQPDNLPAVSLPLPVYPSLPANSLLTPAALEEPLTQHYITQYSNPSGIAILKAALERGSIYLPYIKEEIEKRKLPPELAYLPVIESGFQITARSKSGAVGLWQFMMNSIAPFDIKVNDFVDERRDFQKSTDGALRKLEDNYRALGDWALALAAYNAGYGAVNRTIQKTKIRDYWKLCEKNELRAETIHYVPKLLAVSYIISQPRRFGLDYWPQVFKSDTIILQRQVALDTLADEAGVNRELLRRLNAELLHGITPPGKSHKLKVPRTHLAYINQVLEAENLALLAYQRHIVKHGDTLWSLSRYYNVHIDMITENNPGIADRYLQIGEILTIPSDRELQPPAVRHTETQTFLGTYTVKKGDTLWSLARTYETDPQTLAEANGMELNQILPEGKTLKVPIIER